MLKDAYAERDLAPENLSRTLEDSGTVTSVLIPEYVRRRLQSGILASMGLPSLLHLQLDQPVDDLDRGSYRLPHQAPI